jgi:teichuronic acid exporter
MPACQVTVACAARFPRRRCRKELALPTETIPPPDAAEVRLQARRGISWNLVGAVVTNVMRLVTVVVLGRLLDPHDFGVVAAALTVTVLLHNIRDIGLGPALIQRANLERGHIEAAFATSLYIGLVIAAVLFVAAPQIGRVYDIPESVDVLRALGVIFALRGLSTASMVLCQRAMNFRAVALVDALSYGIGSVVAMTFAARGAGPWSLVAGYLVEELISTVLYLRLSPPAMSLRLSGVHLRELLGFGAGQTVIQLAGILATYGDNFVVGRSLGATALGLYTRAYDLIKLPSAVFGNVVGNVLFPAFSRLQHDQARLAAGFRRVIMVNALVLLPASACLIAIAPEAIRVVMGESWGSAVLPFRILAITMVARTSYKVSAMVASATGAVSPIAIANVIYMVLVVAGALLSIHWGIAGVATTTALSLVVVYLHCTYVAMKVSGVSATDLGRAHLPGLLIALAVALICWPVAIALRSTVAFPALRFAAVALLGVGLSAGGVFLWLRPGRQGDAGWLRAELGRLGRRRR